MNKLLIIIVIVALILSALFIFHKYPSGRKSLALPEPQDTVQYTHPIGPTQEPPYILPSKLLVGVAS